MFGGLMNETILSLMHDRDETGKRRVKQAETAKTPKPERSRTSER